MTTMRLIDANELKKLRDKYIRGEIHFDDECDLVDKCPTVDAEVVVRCKDCYQSVVIGNVLYCTYWRKNTDENGYCHEGG